MRRPQPTARRLLFLSALALGAAPHCSEPPGRSAPVAAGPPAQATAPTGPADPHWLPADGHAVATLGTRPLMDTAVRAAMAAEGIRDPAEALQTAIRVEAVAAAALSEGPRGGAPSAPKDALLRYRQALVQQLLKRRLEEDLTPDTVPMDYVKKAYRAPLVRRRYVHFDAFHLRDFQLICCRETPGMCRAHAKSYADCYRELEPLARDLHRRIVAADPKTADGFDGLFDAVQTALGTRLERKRYSFYHDVKVPWEQNTQVFRMTRAVVDACRSMKVGQVSPAVLDEYGWHVFFLEKHVPEQNRKPEEPEVRREIAANILPKVQQSEFTKLVAEELRARNIHIFPGALDLLRAARPVPEPEPKK